MREHVDVPGVGEVESTGSGLEQVLISTWASVRMQGGFWEKIRTNSGWDDRHLAVSESYSWVIVLYPIATEPKMGPNRRITRQVHPDKVVVFEIQTRIEFSVKKHVADD